MNNVFLLIECFCSDEGFFVRGVFSSREKAESALEREIDQRARDRELTDPERVLYRSGIERREREARILSVQECILDQFPIANANLCESDQ